MVVSFYASVLALVFICLSVNVIVLRRRHRISLGDGQIPELQHAMRAQGNFAEFVPLGLLLLLLLELEGTGIVPIHILGGMLLMGRGFHIAAVAPVNARLIFRQIGMMLTFTMLAVSALMLLVPFLK